MKIEKKYHGILMVRQSIDSQTFVLKPKYIISGILQEDFGELKLIDDMNGSYYLSDDVNTIVYEVETSVAFLITEEELLAKYPNCNLAEARAQYFDEKCSAVHFYNNECVSEHKIDIISLDLADLISRKHTGMFDISDDCGDEKIPISKLLEHVNGYDIVVITIEELKKIISISSYEEMKKRLQQIYNDTVEINNHFLEEDTEKESVLELGNRLSGDSIILLFTSVCDEIQNITSFVELKKILKDLEEILINIMMILEKRGGKEADDCHAANDVICKIIDCFDDISQLNDLIIIKHEIRKLKEKEMINIKQIAAIFDKYTKEFESKRQTSSAIIKEKEKSSKPITVLKARDMKVYLDKKVVGQEEAKKDIISAVIMNSLSDDPSDRTACLLIGPTGCGKTLIIRTIAQYLDKPVEIADATQISVAGYVGLNIEDVLSRLIDKAGGDIKRAEEGIICFDEIDKKGTEKNGDVSGRGVLNSLLSLVQGTSYLVKYENKSVNFDTSKLTVFATGSFAEVVKQLGDGTSAYKNTTIGFCTKNESNKQRDVMYPVLTREDLVKYGHMPEELLGRFSVITQLSGHTKESLKEILVASESSSLLAEQKKLAKFGIDLKWTEGYIDALSENALKLKTGARSLKSAIENSIKEARWAALMNLGEYSCIVLSAKTVDNNLDCTLIDNNGNSYNLQDLVKTTEESPKVKQMSTLS